MEKRTLPVEVFVYFYSMVQDIYLKIGIDDPQALLYPTIKVKNIDSASVSINYYHCGYVNYTIKTYMCALFLNLKKLKNF